MNKVILTAFGFILFFFTQAQTPIKGYYREPSLQNNLLVFAAEGDIWKVSLEGGQAQRLTSNPGEESDPFLSPDGTQVAFAGQYEGVTEVYVMPVTGGVPRRLTYEAMGSVPTGWKSDLEVLYTTNQYSTLPAVQSVTVNVKDLTIKVQPLEMAGESSFSSDGKTLYFVRPTFNNNVTKRYKGGTARKIWKYTEGAQEAEKLTRDFDGEDHHPKWHNGRVWFLSDRDGIMNVWSMDNNGNDIRQHTKQDKYDVREFTLSGDNLVYRVGADLWRTDLTKGSETVINISLSSDFENLREKWVTNPMDYLTNLDVSNDGQKVVLTSRGRVFVIPSKEGRMVQVARKEGVRYRDAVFSSDSRSVILLSDESGEFEFVSAPSNGVGKPRVLTTNGKVLRFQSYPSADGKFQAWTDLKNNGYVLNLSTGKETLFTTNQEGVDYLAWSPDSKWLAYVQTASNSFQQLFIYNIESGKRIAITGDRANSLSPKWSPDGKWLYFLSDRNFESLVGAPWGSRQPEPYFDRKMKIYQVALSAGQRSPFSAKDELSVEDKTDKVNTTVSVKIDEQGLAERLYEVPVSPGNYSGLIVGEKALYFRSRDAGQTSRTHLMFVKIGPKPEIKPFVEGVGMTVASPNNKHLAFMKSGGLYVAELGLSAVSDLSDKKVDLSAWKFSLDPREDWKQIFTDAWRMERDYFYDPGMHGVNWKAMHDKYFPLTDRVSTRDELSDVIGEMVGELSVLHTSVRGGDLPVSPDDIPLGSLGARLVRDVAKGGYVVQYIYQSDPDYPNERSPLSHPDVNVREGSVITMVNGRNVLEVPHINSLLRDQENKQVLIHVKEAQGLERDVIVKPISDFEEYNLKYSDWEYTRRLETERLGKGDLGYVHLRAMGSGDLNQWYRDFYPIFNKKGIIIDVRHNRGGNIDSFILEKLMRTAFFYWKSNVGDPYWNMQYAPIGHLVVLVDEFTASDGEAFAEGFRSLGLGKVIGARTWGGEVWLSGVNTLSDNGIARAPMNGVYNAKGEWVIEGHGFVPDIEVINLPHSTYNGKDAQLEAAVKYLQDLIKKDPVVVPAPPAYPDKSFRNGN